MTQQKYVVYGIHSVISALTSGRRKVFEVLYTNNTKHKIPEKFLSLARLSTDYEISKILEKKGKDINHQGLIAFCSPIIPKQLKDVNLTKENSLALILDNLTDVANIGAIIRSACAFNVNFIVYHKTNMPDVINNEIIIKNSCGGVEEVDLIPEANIGSAIERLKKNGYWIIGLDGSGKENLKSFANQNKDLKKFAIVVGSEGKGMRDLTKKLCDFLVKIEMSNKMESLNVSVATAIALYDLTK